MSESYDTDHQNGVSDKQIDELTRKLEILLEQAKATYTAYDAANDTLDAKGWQIVGITAAVAAIVVPIYIGFGHNDIGQSGWWYGLTVLISIAAAISIFKLVMAVRVGKFVVPSYGFEKLNSIQIVSEIASKKSYTEVLGELLQVYTGPIEPSGDSAIASAMRINRDRYAGFEGGFNSFLAFLALVTFGGAIVALITAAT